MQKGYPVFARCANLPVEIRNSEGVGGGRLVGWLPIVSLLSIINKSVNKELGTGGSCGEQQDFVRKFQECCLA